MFSREMVRNLVERRPSDEFVLLLLQGVRKKAKGYQRSSLPSNIRFRQFEKSLKEVIEEELGVTLTPEQKTKHFVFNMLFIVDDFGQIKQIWQWSIMKIKTFSNRDILFVQENKCQITIPYPQES